MSDPTTESGSGARARRPATDDAAPDDTAVRPAITDEDIAAAEQARPAKVTGTSQAPYDPRAEVKSEQPAPPAPQPEPSSRATAVEEPKPVINNPVKQSAAPRGPRRARLRLTRIDPWTVMKNAFLLSIAFAVVTVVAVGMVWQVLGAAGVWDSINDTIQSGIGGDDVASFQIEDYIGTSRVLGFTMLVAAIDVVLITAAATLTAFLYNMSAALLGGVEVTLSEDVD